MEIIGIQVQLIGLVLLTNLNQKLTKLTLTHLL